MQFKVLQIINEQLPIEVFPNITTPIKLYLTMPIKSCEEERNFSKISFIKIVVCPFFFCQLYCLLFLDLQLLATPMGIFKLFCGLL